MVFHDTGHPKPVPMEIERLVSNYLAQVQQFLLTMILDTAIEEQPDCVPLGMRIKETFLEREFFDFIDVPYIDPSERDAEAGTQIIQSLMDKISEKALGKVETSALQKQVELVCVMPIVTALCYHVVTKLVQRWNAKDSAMLSSGTFEGWLTISLL